MAEEISFEEFASLSLGEQEKVASSIYAGTDHPIFAGIRGAFLEAYPQCQAARVFVGGADAHGYIPAVNVTAEPGIPPLRGLPDTFMGLPVIRQRKRARR